MFNQNQFDVKKTMSVTTWRGTTVKNDEKESKFTSNIFSYQTVYEFGNGKKYLNWNPFLLSLVQDK